MQVAAQDRTELERLLRSPPVRVRASRTVQRRVDRLPLTEVPTRSRFVVHVHAAGAGRSARGPDPGIATKPLSQPWRTRPPRAAATAHGRDSPLRWRANPVAEVVARPTAPTSGARSRIAEIVYPVEPQQVRVVLRGWIVPRVVPDELAARDLPTLRRRSADLSRNNPLAAGADQPSSIPGGSPRQVLSVSHRAATSLLS